MNIVRSENSGRVFRDLSSGDVFRYRNIETLLMKIKYTPSGNIGFNAVSLADGALHCVDNDAYVVSVSGEFVEN